METARERVQSLDARLRELEERFKGNGFQTLATTVLPPQLGTEPLQPLQHGAVTAPGVGAVPTSVGPVTRTADAEHSLSGMSAAQGRRSLVVPSGAPVVLAPRRPEAPLAPAEQQAPHTSGTQDAVPLRLYRQGLPHRDLGPPQSVWEADKNAAVVALADRVQELEEQLQHAQQQQERQQRSDADDANVAAARQHEMPPPPLNVLPVPRTALGSISHTNVTAYSSTYANGRPPLPVKFYPPPPPGEPLSADAAVVRLQAAQGARGQARAFAASVAASAAATVPSVMMRKRRDENAVPQQHGKGGHVEDGAAQMAVADGSNENGGSSVGVSAPLGYARAAASAAASVQIAALREAGPLQPAGPYPMVAAALAAGTPGSGGSTWEQAKMRALVSLEQQRDALHAQVEAYRDQEDRHRRELMALNERHRTDLRDAAGIAGRKLERLMGSAWAAYARRLLVLRVSRALHAWRRIATRNRRLAWAQSVWRAQQLGATFSEWHMLVLTSRQQRQSRRRALVRYQRTVLHAWTAAAAACKSRKRLERRAVLARCRRLLAAWARRVGELRAKRLRWQGAVAHCHRVLLRAGWRGLAEEVARERRAEAKLRMRLGALAARTALQTWMANTRFARRLDAMSRRGVLRSALCSWASFAARAATMRRKLRGLQDSWRLRRQAVLLAGWAAVARRLAQLGAAERALQAADRYQLLAAAFTCLRLAPRERVWGRRRAVVALVAWRELALRAARNRRLVLTRRLARNRASLAAVFDTWRVLAKARSVQLHLREIHRLQDLEPTYEHQMELVRQDRAAVQSHLRAVMAESNLLRAELLRGFVLGAEGGLLGKPLHWRSLPADPDQWLPQPRSRHSTLFLPALQLPAAPAVGSGTQALPMHSSLLRASTEAAAAAGVAGARAGEATGQWQHLGGARVGQETLLRTATVTRTAYGHGHHADAEAVVPGVAGVLVVFGGVSEEEWFRDLHVLELAYTDGGAASFRWHQVEVEAEPEPPTGLQAGTLTRTRPDGRLPLPTRRDHAACVTSPNQFVVVGGFDGSSELMDVNAITVRAAEDGVGWGASVRTVVPRNRAPPGRSHHTVTCHPLGRSLYVFGGYASARGTLGELWAFHLDHHEWWQPNTTGDQPPPRRNHVATLVGGKLYVHGGFTGAECLGDTWVLDPQSWHWDRLDTKGLEPSPRRGHACEVVSDRYLVVHGGYDGAGHLADGAVLDTVTGVWRDLAAAGGPEDMPTARAHHTLTLAGHVMVALGGSGPMGPLLDMHLLESPPLVAGLAQQYKMMATAAQLSATQAGMADVEAALAVTRHRADMAEQQLNLLRERAAELVSLHNAALADIDRLKARVAAEAVRVVAAEAATAEAQLALATAERRLRRTREGGREVAEAARDMHDIVCDLREEVARLRAQLLTATQHQGREAAQLSAANAERQLLQHQLAGCQQEAALLRGMLATAETEFRTALDRQRAAAETEIAAAVEQAKQLAVAAAGAAGGAAAAGCASEMDLVVLQKLATATARAETAELRLHSLEREQSMLQADLASQKRHLEQQRQAREAAEDRAAAAMQHMHASELRYQSQIEDLQRQLVEAQRERWRQDLGLQPPRKRSAPEPPEQVQTAAPQATVVQGVERAEVEENGFEEAERLLQTARPPPEVLVEEPNRRQVMGARVSAVLAPMDPSAHFTVQHIESLVVEDPSLEVLPEVARLLQLQRRLAGQG